MRVREAPITLGLKSGVNPEHPTIHTPMKSHSGPFCTRAETSMREPLSPYHQ